MADVISRSHTKLFKRRSTAACSFYSLSRKDKHKSRTETSEEVEPLKSTTKRFLCKEKRSFKVVCKKQQSASKNLHKEVKETLTCLTRKIQPKDILHHVINEK